MKKLITTLAITFALVVAVGTVSAFAFTAVLSQQNLSVNGESVSCEIYNIDGSNYFKLRDIAMLLNGSDSTFSVEWDAAQATISIKTGAEYIPDGSELIFVKDKSASTVKSSAKILIDGKSVENLSVYNIGGNNFFKLRDLGKALKFKVDYNEESKTMLVNSLKKATDFEITVEGSDKEPISAVYFGEDVVLKGDNFNVSFVNCVFEGNIINEGSGRAMAFIDTTCELSEDTQCIINNNTKEADFIMSPFPKFFDFSDSINVICKDCIGAAAGYRVAILNGVKYTAENADYFYAADGTCVPYSGQEFDLIMACQAWENGEKKVVTFCVKE